MTDNKLDLVKLFFKDSPKEFELIGDDIKAAEKEGVFCMIDDAFHDLDMTMNEHNSLWFADLQVNMVARLLSKGFEITKEGTGYRVTRDEPFLF